MILCSRTQERDASNVDLLNSIGKRAVRLCDCGRERVEVADDNGDWLDVLFEEILCI